MGFLNNTDPRERAVNQQIQQTHNQINELYLDLGRYVKLNLKDKIDDQYVRNAAQNIDDCLARLQQLNNDLNSIKGIKLCCNCSAQIPIAVTFCPSCGTKQPDMQMNNMNGGMGAAPMNNGFGAPMNNGMNNNMGAPMNNGMNNNMGAPVNNTMNAPANNGGFGGAAPVPTPVPTPAPAPSPAAFTPSSSGNSPANANKNKIGANTQPPIPAAPAAPANDIPPVPAAPQQNDMLKDIPPVPPMPNTEQNTSAPSEIPNVPPMPEMPDKKPPEAEGAPVAAPAPVIEDKPTGAPAPAAAPSESFIFCSQCGHKESSGVAFCSQCGSKL